MEDLTIAPSGFAALGLSPTVLSVLARAGLTTPTPIQEQAIPIAMTGADLIGVAQTGTGKTLAFALPLLEKMHGHHDKALILVPTRELALQVEEAIQRVSGAMKPFIRTVVLIGGASMGAQVGQLRARPRIVIATPGRLQDHLNQGTIQLDTVTTLILDEADRMLDMGFLGQIKQILKSVPNDRQTMLFSATMAPEVAKLASGYMRDPIKVEVARQGTAAELIEQQLCFVGRDRKIDVLNALLKRHAGSVLVFSRTKHGATKIARSLAISGHNTAEIHSNRSLPQRRAALDGFKSGRYRILVATDIAARGIDVTDIALVVNFDLPVVAEDYVHRIGRTGRAGKSGMAISLAEHDQQSEVRTIERLLNMTLPLHEDSEARQTMAPPRPAANTQRRPSGGGWQPYGADRGPGRARGYASSRGR